ncbi:sulfotransferase family 2 domain-containing protein [Paraburkholderia sp. CNPSo 3272]|uniref:sulfotransferase family 2 domain-containing protein n=1 Tax=Paraburkholderia sp. CNPSo 3272 TaxID=2940931 RepID=UPI0020B65E04|nr:sulfotransferase family 2 domain-containing protein [Paraburkholderia sp. CNPSo 3272]MCP3728267.1 sulfotransferase family 2 domain-containing protein [Paraburkholderia sp. CNPSo 3272]
MRTVIVHYHLFKNAGTTVDGILDRNFPGDARGHLEGPYPWSTVLSNEILEFALSKPDLRVISSHQARLPLPQHPSIAFLPILFLRHPIDRFASVYEFERRQAADSLSPSVAVARNGSLAAFADWTVAREATAVCRNFQVAHLAGAQYDMRYARATHTDYLQALVHLRSLPFFGMVESFEESLESLQKFVQPHIGELKFDFSIENVTPGRKATLESRLEHIESELGVSLYRELLELNALDLLLYREAKQIFAANRARLCSVQDDCVTVRKTLWQRLTRNFRTDAKSPARA